ncbi:MULTISPECIES: ESX secretion-associated protein EspG [unclassified Saccharopolyspora]|uniref:ESX secretion-associated protein EspG n=1 Tax=unclassified Saccharopolyspora TaxID=2646250 RepID=UPI001CD7900D|nr:MULTISPECIES: ESX secretion-associated protein EspG [unclassified Saccharopolyspora]MCA1190235.1 ESX secretion-associated protein EspG [Saccharopolyspora sp. 6T]MCA1280054.1 ESX secretion-associated protein EspG [Saccharopolyspora sp. 7B]
MASKLDVDRLELGVLTGWAGVKRLPPVLRFSHYGTPLQNINAEIEAADARCRQRGLLDHANRVSDEVWDLVAAYQRAAVEYDLRFSSQKGTELRVAVSQVGQVTIRSVLNGDRVIIERVRPESAIPSLVSTLPDHPPAKFKPVNIDLAALRAVMAEAAKASDADSRAVEKGLRARGLDASGFRAATELLDGPKLGAGQVGVTVWNSQRKEFRGSSTMQIVDLEVGRVSIYNSGSQRLIAGADMGTFRRVLGDLTTGAQRLSTW